MAAPTDAEQAEAVAEEIARLLEAQVTVRDRMTGARRTIGPGDIAVLFRTREGHRLLEQALAKRRVPFYVYKGLGFFDADEIKDVLALLAFLGDPSSNLRAAALLRSRLVRVSDEGLKQLAPDLAGALDPDGPAFPEWLSPEDVARLTEARRSLAGWLPLVDRLPPAELLDRVLAEAAYTRELAGPGLAQARENLKKIRGLVRRIQNRGYATIERLVEHFSQLVSGGDESNAIIDAVDAVNLMTVHAAKGLEFPVVFVVNLGRGSGGGRDPIRVAMGAASGEAQGEPMVAIGEHESEADEDAAAREAEETKRLLYVALTRARDRLYLCATLPEAGRFAPMKGSLGRLLPPSLLVAAGDVEPAATRWCGPGPPRRTPSAWCRRPVPSRGLDRAHRRPRPGSRTTSRRSRRTACRGSPPPSSRRPRPRPSRSQADRSSSLLGTLVHRLLAYAQQRDERDPGELARVARQFIEGGHEIEDAGDIVRRAVSLSLGVLSRPGADDAARRGRRWCSRWPTPGGCPAGPWSGGPSIASSSPTTAPPCSSSRPGRRATSIGISWPHTSRRSAGTTPTGASKGRLIYVGSGQAR